MKIKLISLILFCTVQTFAQMVERLEPKDAGVKEFPSLFGTFNIDKKGIYHTGIKENGDQRTLEIARLNESLGNMFSQQFPLEDKEEFQLMEVRHNKICIFTTRYDGHDKSLFLIILDNTTGKILAQKQKLSALDSDPIGVKGRSFSILFSPEERRMMIVSAFQWPKKPQVVKADVYDLATMKIINTVSIPDNYNGQNIKSESYQVTDEGNILYTMRTDVKEKDAAVTQTLCMYNAATRTDKYLDLPLQKKKIENSYVFLNNGLYFIAGVFKDDYSRKDDKDNKAGIFCLAVDVNGLSMKTQEFNYFSAETEAKLTYKDGEKKRNLADKGFVAKNLVRTPTGFYIVENLTYKAEVQGSNIIYIMPVSRELIISRFNNEGQLQFTKVLPKFTLNKMYEQDIVLYGENLYIFYCEHPKNLERYTLDNFEPEEYNKVADLRGPVAVCVKVDEKGNAIRQELMMNETWCYWPGSGVVLKEGKELVVMEIQKDEYTLEVFRLRN
jgi:hypothetical protein